MATGESSAHDPGAWTKAIPPDLWVTAAESMPWFKPRRRRKKLKVFLHARFLPPGNGTLQHGDEYLRRSDLENLIIERRIELEKKVHDLNDVRHRKTLKVLQLFAEACGSDEKVALAAAVVKRMRLSITERDAIADTVKNLVLAPKPESPPATKPPTAPSRSKTEIAAAGRLLDEASSWTSFLNRLSQTAREGNPEAAKHLQDFAQHSAMLLLAAVRLKPEIFRPLAAKATLWPVMASTDPKWVHNQQRILRDLTFGQDTIYGRLKPALAYDKDVAPRAWAKQAIETLHINREWLANDSTERSLVLLRGDHDVRVAPVPHWAHLAAKLPPLSRSTARQWAIVSREMIRDQCPELELHPDWKSVARRFEHLPTAAGVVRNKVLDAIGSAIRSIARADLPKPGS